VAKKVRSTSPTGPASGRPSAASAALAQDPLAGDALKTLAVRIALILAALWLMSGLVAGFVQSRTTSYIVLGVAAVVTIGVVGVAIYALQRAQKARGVAGLLASVKTDEDRKRVMAELDTNYKADDPAAVFARAQLQLQEDPRAALATLERIPLTKVMATVADEARAQRALIHLLLSEATQARDLVDGIDLSRHSDPKTKAMLTSVTAEAWARTGQVKKAETLNELFNPEDEAFEHLRPQLWRARAFVSAYSNDSKGVKRALKKLLQIDVRLLGGFLGSHKVHPLLQREAKLALEQSGQVPRKMNFQRH
jgi:hypothetical protein